ncbi:YodL domain-containing protein [Clostridium sp. M62/1]|uniref:LPD16 domain-containing protein n=1 Tax=Clostridium sp. M62/1 TaxID=411486 RepID=UPI0001973BC2|nr:LPD16 domain-containing protein [Clostridium sp. M62/1]EFE14211.1 CHC2 zinc finger domain protein [Clostridium sp. M62/1]UEB79088.1 YodL domain-containing protein [Clostridium sp. M62/1]
MVNLFETVKQSVPIKEAAQMYGIEVKRGGMACCPFHDDKHPSMKLNEDYFYCFGCGATGDVIELTARLYNLFPKEAAEKLAQDFGLIYDSQAPPRRYYVRQKSEAQKFKESRDHAFRVLADYFHLLRKWEANYTPKTPEETMHPRFLEAVQQKDYVGYLLDFFLEESPEEQKLWIAEHQSEIANLERRVKIMADKPTNRERLQEITAGIEQGIKELFESEKYMRYLSVMSKFHRYSVNNTMLIYMQRPDATLVAGFNKWKNQFERHVKKGEHGITIIAPTPYKKKIEEMKRDPDTKAPILDADGKAVMEEKEIEIPMFRPVKVFDVSQTDGKPLPELASSLSGTVPHYEAFLEAVRRSAPVPIEFEPMADNMDGYFSSDQQRIAIRPGMSEVQTVSAAVHEVAHSKLHDPKNYEAEPTWKIVMVSEGGIKHDYRLDFATEAEAEQAAAEDGWRYVDENRFEWRLEVEEDLTAVKQAVKNRNTEEVEAESISYAVCQYFGIQTGANSFGYIATWSKDKDLKELKASLETINKTSCELINDMERHYKEICKERGIDLTAPKKETVPVVLPPVREQAESFAQEYVLYAQAVHPETLSETEVQARIAQYTDKILRHDIADMVLFLEEQKQTKWEQDEEVEMNLDSGAALDAENSDFWDPEHLSAQLASLYRTEYQEVSDNAEHSPQEPAEPSEALFLLNDATYLHIQPCDTGWDYTLYDKETMKELDGGQLDEPELSRSAAVRQICEGLELENPSIQEAPLSMIETLQDAACQQMQEQVSQQAEDFAAPSTQLPDAQEQALDEYPMPDPALTQDVLEKCGYLDNDLLPLSKERAYELMERDLTVYIVQEGKNPEMAFDTADLDAHDGLFAVSREEWEESSEFGEIVKDRMNHQEEREQAFLSHEGDCFAIYQVKHTDELRDIRYEGLEWLKSIGQTVQRENYELVYTAPLQPCDLKGDTTEQLFYRFNNEHPADYRHPSMSVSDIVAIKRDGKVSCHYCDSFGFEQVPGFLPDNPLKNAEMAVEDDYGMIDGIINNGPKEPTVAQLEQQARSGQPISLMDLAAAAHREEREKKKSVMEQLKSQPRTEHKKAAPKKSAEREI